MLVKVKKRLMKETRVTQRDKTKSVIWVHFCVNKDGKNICVYCQHAVAARDGNTSNLFLHL